MESRCWHVHTHTQCRETRFGGKAPNHEQQLPEGRGSPPSLCLNHLFLPCFPFMALRQREEEGEEKKVKSQQNYLAFLPLRMEIPQVPVLVGCSLVNPWAQHTAWNIICVQLTTVD